MKFRFVLILTTFFLVSFFSYSQFITYRKLVSFENQKSTIKITQPNSTPLSIYENIHMSNSHSIYRILKSPAD